MTAPQTDPILRPGAIVGEYQITHRLGEGGMGVVFAAVHPEIGKQVAIKVLAPHAAQDPGLIRRFKEEARAVNKIRHPNIIDIFGFNQLSDGRHYFVMEYLEGESLTARLERGAMALGEMRRLLLQICSALQAAHEAGIIHRDLKPDNVWVATEHLAQPEIKLLDFGIAKLNDPTTVKTTQTGAPIGTPHYMSPEQAMGRPVDHRADIYALGVVLYEIFAGKLPFDGVTVHEIVFKHMTEMPPPPSSHRPIVPPSMEAIILDCLQKDPARRPSSMRELSERIEAAFAAGAGGVSARVPPIAATLHLPTPGRTELLADSPERRSAQLAGKTRALAPPRAAFDPRVASDDFGRRDRATAARRRRWGPVAAIVVLCVGAVGVGVGVLGRRSPDASETAPSPSGAAPEPAAAPVRPPVEPAIEPPSVRPPPDVPRPPASAEAPPIAPPTAGAEAEPEPRRHDKRHRPARKKADAPAEPRTKASASATKPEPGPKPEAAPAAKPNCNPNFYLDAQGDKHFKPECF